MMMSFVALGAVGLAWALVAYSEAFADGSGFSGFLPERHSLGCRGRAEGTIPHLLFMAPPGNLRHHHAPL